MLPHCSGDLSPSGAATESTEAPAANDRHTLSRGNFRSKTRDAFTQRIIPGGFFTRGMWSARCGFGPTGDGSRAEKRAR
jgi:hypothetical protein